VAGSAGPDSLSKNFRMRYSSLARRESSVKNGGSTKVPNESGKEMRTCGLGRAFPHGCVGEVVGLGVILAGDVGDGEFQGAGEFAAGPVQRVEAGAAADVFAAHLADDDFGIGINVESFGLQGKRALEGFHQGDVFGDVVVLVADPFGDANRAAGAAVDDYSDTRWSWVAQRTTIHISHEF
jgi:hypothetical protein